MTRKERQRVRRARREALRAADTVSRLSPQPWIVISAARANQRTARGDLFNGMTGGGNFSRRVVYSTPFLTAPPPAPAFGAPLTLPSVAVDVAASDDETAMVLVSNGVLAPGAAEKIERYLRDKLRKDGFHNTIVLPEGDGFRITTHDDPIPLAKSARARTTTPAVIASRRISSHCSGVATGAPTGRSAQ